MVVTLQTATADPILKGFSSEFTAPPTATLNKLKAMMKAAKLIKKDKANDDTRILSDLDKPVNLPGLVNRLSLLSGYS